MQPEMTPAVARALQVAQHLALSQGSADVQPAHLLAGLCHEEEGRVAELLRQAGLDPAVVRQAFAAAPAASQPLPTETPLPLSIEAKNSLAAARKLSAELHGDLIVASDSLLLALLREDAQLRRRLEEIGLKAADVASTIGVQQTPLLQLDEPLQLVEPTEQIDSARILDANANRAREALRVLEDYCRFVLDDAFLSRELKMLRHEFAESLADVGPTLLLEARDTQHDVGTGLTSRREQERHSILEVVRANAKR